MFLIINIFLWRVVTDEDHGELDRMLSFSPHTKHGSLLLFFFVILLYKSLCLEQQGMMFHELFLINILIVSMT